MNRLLSLLTLLWVCSCCASAQSGHRVVVEDEERIPIIGAHVRYGDTNHISVSDTRGQVLLPSTLSHDTNLSISCIGYEPLTTRLRLLPKRQGQYIVTLTEARIQLGSGVVVTARRAPITHSAVVQIGTVEIQKQAGRSLADLLEGVSGVSSIRSGASTAKPVVHGMHGSRLMIIHNGVKQTGQQWGEGHAPEVDLSGSHAIHVIKGAEGVRYGAEALGGAIIMEQRGLPYGRETISGDVAQGYSSNGRRFVTSASLDGSIPRLPQIGWRIQGLYANGGDRSTANYLLNNTGERELNGSATLGLDLNRLRLEAFYSRYDSRHGILRSAQLGSVHVFLDRIALGRPLEETLTPFSRVIDFPHEHVVHHTVTGKAFYELGSWGKLAYQGAYQSDSREEFRIRRTASHIPELALSLRSLQHRLVWSREGKQWDMELGVQHSSTDNHNVPGTGVVPVIPNYTEQSWGVYSLHKFAFRTFSLEGGVRLDRQVTHADGYNIDGLRYGGKRSFGNMSYNLGARYTPSRALSLTTNVGIAWRAPHVHELYADGADHGSAAYIVGDSTLLSEQSYKAIASIDYRTDWLHLTLDGYVQLIHDYIYDEPSLRPDGTPEYRELISGTYPVFRYRQTNAWFRGLDLNLELRPWEWLRYKCTTALIYANELRTNAFLPFIPPLRVDQSIAVELGHFGAFTPRISLGHRFVAKQKRFEPHRDLVSDTPSAYHLLSAELECLWHVSDKHDLRLSLSGDNLLNREYKEYTNRARYYSHDLGRDIRLMLAWQF